MVGEYARGFLDTYVVLNRNVKGNEPIFALVQIHTKPNIHESTHARVFPHKRTQGILDAKEPPSGNQSETAIDDPIRLPVPKELGGLSAVPLGLCAGSGATIKEAPQRSPSDTR